MRSTAALPRFGPRSANKLDPTRQRSLLGVVEIAPPVLELVGELDLPHHASMSHNYLVVKTHERIEPR